MRLNFTTTWWQATTYLVGVTLFSISFLVFMNSAVSFVVTDVVGQLNNVGKAVGDLGFADELVALVACPFWGLMSDKIGVRAVAFTGYFIIGLSLFTFVQARNVYPQLLLGRVFFSLGAAASSTMVTAILPTMTLSKSPRRRSVSHIQRSAGASADSAPLESSHASMSDATKQPSRSARSQIAGLVGMFSGLGALLALAVFLPLPPFLAKLFAGDKSAASKGTSFAYYTVGLISLLVAFLCLYGLRGLPGEERKGIHNITKRNEASRMELSGFSGPSRFGLNSLHLFQAFKLGFVDVSIGLGYLGGFVARASSVAISLFIPLFVNVYFIRTGQCHNSAHPGAPGDIKEQCRRAYTLAAALSGVSQLIALLCAPLFGYLDGRFQRFNLPLLVAALCGVVGYTAFARLPSPDPKSEDGNGAVFLVVALMGISQIGAIVCSLSLLSRGVHGGEQAVETSAKPPRTRNRGSSQGAVEGENGVAAERTTLLPPQRPLPLSSKSTQAHLKGSIAGIYSLSGGAGILLLTKLGGQLFDSSSPGAPFYMLATFNAILLAVGLGCGVWEEIQRRRRR